MAYINGINNKISLPVIPSFAKNGSIFTKYKIWSAKDDKIITRVEFTQNFLSLLIPFLLLIM